MKFNLNDFVQLDVKSLLAVNGGGNCSSTNICASSSGGSCSSGPSTSSSGGASCSSGPSTSVRGGNSCGSVPPSTPPTNPKDGDNTGETTPNGGGNCSNTGASCGSIGGIGNGSTEVNDSGIMEDSGNEQSNQAHVHQIPDNPDDYHCDINSYNVAVDQGIQNPGDWDGNSLSVDQIYTQNYSNDSNDSPVSGTTGYGFYDNEGDGTYDHMFFYDYTDGGNTYHVWNSDGIAPVAESDWSINGTAVDHSVYVPLE